MPIGLLRRLVGVTALALAAGLPVVPAAVARVPVPHVTELTVRAGGVHGGTRTVVRGYGFTGATAVLYGSKRGTHLQVLGPHRIAVVSPAQPAGRVHVRVVNRSGPSPRTSADVFTYVAPPRVTATGTLHPGETVNLHGGPFRDVRRVTIAATSVPFTTIDPTTIIATVPALSGDAPVPIQVADAYGLSPVFYAFVVSTPKLQIAATSVAWNDVQLAMTTSSDPDAQPTTWDSVRLERTYYPPNGAMSTTTVLGDLPPTTTSYDDTTVEPNSSYRYSAVPMLGGTRQTPYSPVDVDTPSQPSAPVALTSGSATVRTATSVVLRWIEPGAVNFDSVMIRRSVGTTPPATPTDGDLVTDDPSFTGPFLDDGVAPSTTYTYALFPTGPDGAWAAPTVTTTVTPTAGAGWSAPVDESPAAPLDDITCEPGAGICHAYSGGSEPGLAMRDSSGAWTWQAPRPTTQYAIEQLACSGIDFCMARTQSGDMVAYRAGAWSTPVTVTTGYARPALSCASPTFCLLSSAQGAMRWDGSTWSLAAGTPTGTGAISCVAPSWCMVETDSQVYAYDGTTWTATDNGTMPVQGHVDGPPTGIDPGPISCTSTTFCMITGIGYGQEAYATWNGSTWVRTRDWGLSATHQGVWSLDCGSASACVLESTYGQYGTLGFDGQSWGRYDFETAPQNILGFGCYAPTDCIAMTPTSEYRFTGGS